MEWYLVQSKPHREKMAAMNLQRLGVEAFCPQLRRAKTAYNRNRVLVSPLFPGYVFCKFDVLTHRRAVTYATGVSRLVTFGTEPALVEETIIESIKSRMQDDFVTLAPVSFTAGQRLRITDGPLIGLEAVFESELSGSQRVALLLQSVTYQARVIIDRDQLAIA